MSKRMNRTEIIVSFIENEVVHRQIQHLYAQAHTQSTTTTIIASTQRNTLT